MNFGVFKYFHVDVFVNIILRYREKMVFKEIGIGHHIWNQLASTYLEIHI